MSAMNENERLTHYIEMWKQSVETQQHFNDIEWRIRGLALTVATFAIGAAGVTARDGDQIGPVSLGSLVIIVGLLLWYAFYFVDRAWYHPLLKGAVTQGTAIEAEILKSLPQAGMTSAITAASPYPRTKINRIITGKSGDMHSDDKLAWFYLVGAAALVLVAIGLQVAALIAGGKPVPQTRIRE